MDTSFLTLTVNAGSSSVKVGVFDAKNALLTSLRIENIGQSRAVLVDADSKMEVPANDHHSAMTMLMSRLFDHYSKESFVAVGYRVVHGGGRFIESTVISNSIIEDLRALTPFDPLHLPIQILAIEHVRQVLPLADHIACFDTAFYHDMPKQARLLPIPRRYYDKGIRRYGFHGLSYSYLIDQLCQLEGDAVANGKVIFAHLGSGASLTATYNGMPVDTTMSLTPVSGVMMSTRSGDLDPGLFSVLHGIDGMTADEFNTMVSNESGLLGVSGISADMATLIERYSSDEQAAEAVDLFCYEVQKAIGSLVAVLGGLDALVFAGGIGENAPFIREKISQATAHFGDGDVMVRMIKTNEESVIAKEVRRLVAKEA